MTQPNNPDAFAASGKPISAIELSDAIHDQIDIKNCCGGFHFNHSYVEKLITSYTKAVRNAALEEAAEYILDFEGSTGVAAIEIRNLKTTSKKETK